MPNMKFENIEAPITIAPIMGYASIYNVADTNNDIMAKTVFDKNISKKLIPPTQSHVKMLYQHKVDCPVGCWNEFKSDDKGLFVKGFLLLDAPMANEIYELLKGGALNGLSVGFKCLRAAKNAQGIRTILEAQLWEISIVTFPMASGARITHVGERCRLERTDPVRAGQSTQTARRAPFPPSGARHFADALQGAAKILNQ